MQGVALMLVGAFLIAQVTAGGALYRLGVL